MPKAVKIAGNPALDPTLPKIEREFNGEKYFLCFTFGAIAIADRALKEAGSSCTILKSLDLMSSLDATVFGPLLYAALIECQPEITLADAESMINMRNYTSVYESIVAAYVASMAEPEKGDKKTTDPEKPE